MNTEKMTFRPFSHIYEDYDGNVCQHTFVCQKCGSHSAVKILKPFGEYSFWSGYFMCAICGTSLCNGSPINYYSDCFIRKNVSQPIQLSLF